MEYVTDVILNIKSIVVKNFSENEKVIRIEKNTKGPVTVADVITDGTVEVINKNLHICTLTADVPFHVEDGRRQRSRLRARHGAQPER